MTTCPPFSGEFRAPERAHRVPRPDAGSAETLAASRGRPRAWPCRPAAPLAPELRHQLCLRSRDEPCHRSQRQAPGLSVTPAQALAAATGAAYTAARTAASGSDCPRGFPVGLRVPGASWGPAPGPPASTPRGHCQPPGPGAPAGGPPGRRAPHRPCLPAGRAGTCSPRAPAGVPDLGPAGGQGVAAALWVSGEGGPSEEEGPASADLRTDPVVPRATPSLGPGTACSPAGLPLGLYLDGRPRSASLRPLDLCFLLSNLGMVRTVVCPREGSVDARRSLHRLYRPRRAVLCRPPPDTDPAWPSTSVLLRLPAALWVSRAVHEERTARPSQAHLPATSGPPRQGPLSK